jgi:hypothetical protein
MNLHSLCIRTESPGRKNGESWLSAYGRRMIRTIPIERYHVTDSSNTFVSIRAKLLVGGPSSFAKTFAQRGN